MLDSSMRAAQTRGDAVSILIAAEWPIYGRFGYAPTTWSADYVLHRSRRGAVPAGDPTRVRTSDFEEIAAVGADVPRSGGCSPPTTPPTVPSERTWPGSI